MAESSPIPTSVQLATSVASSLATSFVPSVISTAAALATADAKPPPSEDEGTGECKLLGPFAVLIQAALGGLALLSLVYKRWRERPQRPIKVWAFDVSKQVFGSVLLHLANLLMSMFSAGEIQAALAKAAAGKVGAQEQYRPNPCSFYLLNLAIDTTIGIPILIIILKVLNVGASYTPLAKPPESIRSGYYGDPPRATWWLKQSFIYFVGLMGMKTCVFFIFQLLPWIGRVGDWALRWTEGNEAIQIAFVMLIFPLIMNAMQYYIIDMFIKRKDTKEEREEREEREQDGEEDEQGRLLGNDTMSHGDSIDEGEAFKTSTEVTKPGFHSTSKEAGDTIHDDDTTRNGEASSGTSDSAEEDGIRDRPRI